MRMLRRCISTAIIMLIHLACCSSFVIFSTKNNLRYNQCLVVGKDKLEVSD